MTALRLLIADDHLVVREGLRAMLSSVPDFSVVGEAANGQEALDLVEQLRPDVLLMDLRMTKMDGISAVARIRQRGLTTPILILTTFDSHSDILHALEAGATGYILKNVSREQLFDALRTVAQHKSVFAPEVATFLLQHVQKATPALLTQRELEVLELVARGASNKEAARHLHISEATIKSHLLRIFSKLGVEDRTAAVTAALEKGQLRLPREDL